jgi:hypothetical protein
MVFKSGLGRERSLGFSGILEGFPTVSRESAVAALEEAKYLLLARTLGASVMIPTD